MEQQTNSLIELLVFGGVTFVVGALLVWAFALEAWQVWKRRLMEELVEREERGASVAGVGEGAET